MHQKVHDIGTLKCDRCDIRFTVQSLLRHQKQFHPDILRMAVKQPCEICKVMCYSQSALGTKSNLRQKWFCYANCTHKIFKFSDSHAAMHSDGEFECCQMKFTFEGLEVHNKRSHQQQSEPCPICKVRFAHASYLGNLIQRNVPLVGASSNFFKKCFRTAHESPYRW